MRGVVCGLMTALGGLGHTLPFLFHDFRLAMTVAMGVVVIELSIISLIRWKYMDTPFLICRVSSGGGRASCFPGGLVYRRQLNIDCKL